MQYRQASAEDLNQLVLMLADDELGTSREDLTKPLNKAYLDAFHQIVADPNNELTVVVLESKIVGVMQLTFIPYLTHRGSWRCLIEGVRIHTDYRSKGLGQEMINWAINRAKQRGCHIVQLTSDKQRKDAQRFYEKLGFKATHEGFKLHV